MFLRTLIAICMAVLPAAGAVLPGTPPGTSPEAAPPGGVTPAAIAAFIADYREETGLPGAAVAVTKGTEVVHVAGYGVTATGEPVTADTPMPVASVSKSFTALAVMRLVEEGRIGLDDPVRRHLPEFTMADPRAEKITVRQLLHQTSGMADSAFHERSLPQPTTLKGAVARLRTARLAAEPGTVFDYHNTNYQVAARLVEVVSGRPFAEYLDAQVFAPLGMRHSRTVDTDRDLPPGSRGHLYILGRAVALPEPTAFGNGSGGVLTTANDMAQWLIAQRDGRISPRTVEEMRTPSAQNDGYALGWMLDKTKRGTPVVEHGGDLFTATAEQLLMPASGYGVAVMANTGMAFADAGALMDGLVALIEGEKPEIPASPFFVTDLVFALLLLATVGLAARGVVRSGRWAARRSGWRWWLGLLPHLGPLALCAAVVPVFRILARGSDISWIQVVYLYPSFMAWLVTAAVAGPVLVAARLVQTSRYRRTASTRRL
ncbi:serine hydrolase domain-containing protein [Streptosporangium sandarakinum]|uniref:serine hydrolase domain-containing protein n=1 Tax=Streptosporangium sandarakinum TaxID=1260955 RepID=UPI003446EB9B